MRGVRGRSASCASRVSPRGLQALSITAHWHRPPEVEAVPPAPPPPPPHALCPEPQTHRSSLHLITGLAQDEPEAPASDSSSQSQQVSLERRTPVNELNCLPEENTVFNSTINHFRVLTQIGFYHHSHVPLSRLGDVNLFIRKRRTKVILTDATQMTDTDG